MRLRNKKTGQVGNFVINRGHFECLDLEYVPEYSSLAELNAEWEDYEEPVQAYYIDFQGDIHCASAKDNNWSLERIIGNYFATKEEAERAVEKLKAWKRLKDKGFRFVGWYDSVSDDNPDNILFKLDENAWETATCDDLGLLFSQEDD